MRSKLHWASGVAVAATMFTALVATHGSGAAAEEIFPSIVAGPSATTFVSNPVVQDVPVQPEAEEDSRPEPVSEPAPAISATSLRQLVAAQPQPKALSREMRCLAGAIYFESRGESLEGQLAVGRVIIERMRSHRFPESYCGVVFQRSQFSFVKGGRMPTIRKSSAAWRRAVAMAQIAHDGSWDSPVEGALFFHATRVSPNWRLKRLARVDNHIFYR